MSKNDLSSYSSSSDESMNVDWQHYHSDVIYLSEKKGIQRMTQTGKITRTN